MNTNIILGIALVFIISWGVSYKLGYSRGAYNTSNDYKLKIQELTISNIEATQSVLREWKNRENKLVADYLKKIEILKEEHQHEIESIQSTQLSDTVTTTECLQPASSHTAERVPQATKARPSTICYSEADILRKVKESMVIAEECDELAHRYNTLLEVVQTYTGK